MTQRERDLLHQARELAKCAAESYVTKEVRERMLQNFSRLCQRMMEAQCSGRCNFHDWRVYRTGWVLRCSKCQREIRV